MEAKKGMDSRIMKKAWFLQGFLAPMLHLSKQSRRNACQAGGQGGGRQKSVSATNAITRSCLHKMAEMVKNPCVLGGGGMDLSNNNIY